jgi:hypothetical protein
MSASAAGSSNDAGLRVVVCHACSAGRDLDRISRVNMA